MNLFRFLIYFLDISGKATSVLINRTHLRIFFQVYDHNIRGRFLSRQSKFFISIACVFIVFSWIIYSDKIPGFSFVNFNKNSESESKAIDESFDQIAKIEDVDLNDFKNEIPGEKRRKKSSAIKKMNRKNDADLSTIQIEHLPPVFIQAIEKLEIAFEKEGFNSYAVTIVKKLYKQLNKGSNPDLLANIVKEIGDMDDLSSDEQKQLKEIVVNTLWPES